MHLDALNGAINTLNFVEFSIIVDNYEYLEFKFIKNYQENIKKYK